jgi:hypothetical protein
MKRDPLLANRWRASKVRRCLRTKDKAALVQFLNERHRERFFEPLRHLQNAPGNTRGYGFAMMALCSLLVETFQSYRDGIPTTFRSELDRFRSLSAVPVAYRIPAGLQVNGKKTFRRFFGRYRRLFAHVSGARFYKNIRNGLLHQGQTKAGWTLRKRGSTACDPQRRIIFRDDFVEKLEVAFGDYLKELQKRPWNSKLWTNAARKIWWLIRLSL